MMSEKSRMRMCLCETRGVKRRRGWCERGERGEERMDGTGGEAGGELRGRAEPAARQTASARGLAGWQRLRRWPKSKGGRASTQRGSMGMSRLR